MFTQPRDPNNKTKPVYKTFYILQKNKLLLSASFENNRDDEGKHNAYAISKPPQQFSVHYFLSSSRDNNNSYRTDKRPTESLD